MPQDPHLQEKRESHRELKIERSRRRRGEEGEGEGEAAEDDIRGFFSEIYESLISARSINVNILSVLLVLVLMSHKSHVL